MEEKLKEETITTRPGENTLNAIARVLGDVVLVLVRPVLNTHLDYGRERFVVTYR